MSVVRFISDLHFGHEKIATHKRKFKTVEEHDAYIIKQWNKVVHKKDTTYILGDVTMEKKKYKFLDQLKGRKIVILGNHDMRQHVTELQKHVQGVAGMVKYKVKGYPTVFLSHSPLHPREIGYRVKYNIHGHSHLYNVMKGKWFWERKDERYINVCCEQIDYTPKRIDELLPKR